MRNCYVIFTLTALYYRVYVYVYNFIDNLLFLGDNGLHTGPQSCYIRRPLSPMVWDKAGGKLVSSSGERGILTKCFWLEWSQRNFTLQGALLNF